MFATLTSKGQITLPKEIRDRLGLDAGSMLDFQILEDNTITARRVVPDARRIRGLLKSPHETPLTVEQPVAQRRADAKQAHRFVAGRAWWHARITTGDRCSPGGSGMDPALGLRPERR